MQQLELINKLIKNRTNNLSVKTVEVIKEIGSLGNPKISVGTLPYYEWDKEKEITFVLTYGRYLNCNMLVYDKDIKKDKSYVFCKGKKQAITELKKILNTINKPI